VEELRRRVMSVSEKWSNIYKGLEVRSLAEL
jgi:hypothetical protein